MLNISTNTIRKYEEDFQLNIARNELGHRIYRQEDVEILKQIIEMKNTGANIHVIRKVLLKNHIVDEQREANASLVTLDQITVSEFKEIMLKQVAEMILQREKELVEEFEQKLESAREEIAHQIRCEFEKREEKIREQIEAENQKLLIKINEMREKEKNKGFFRKFFSKE